MCQEGEENGNGRKPHIVYRWNSARYVNIIYYIMSILLFYNGLKHRICFLCKILIRHLKHHILYIPYLRQMPLSKGLHIKRGYWLISNKYDSRTRVEEVVKLSIMGFGQAEHLCTLIVYMY